MNDPESHNRFLVGQAISDIQGSIHANDSKSAAGLIVHGLLVTAVVTLASRLGPIYDEASAASQAIIKVALGGMLLLAALSIACLIKAIRPYEPKAIGTRLARRSQGVFFPDIRTLTNIAKCTGQDELDQLWPKFKALEDADTLDSEYLIELLKVADIRAKEADWAKRGFLLLGIETVFVAVYLVMVGCIAGNLLGAGTAQARTARDITSLRWDVAQGARHESVSGNGKRALSRTGLAHVQLDAYNAAGLKAVQFRALDTFRCVGAQRASQSIVHRLSTQRALVTSAKSVSLVAALDLARHPCAGLRRHPVKRTIRVSASARSDSGELRAATLKLSDP